MSQYSSQYGSQIANSLRNNNIVLLICHEFDLQSIFFSWYVVSL